MIIMKLIENSIDGDQLQTSISHADLKDNMASCDLETMKNGVNRSEKKSSSEKAVLPNGICNSPLKQNGYLDDTCDEDFQLVLESSSEDGGSPVKKIYDDTISAPQIVQEIEDLLGIDANSAGIDEELEKDLVLLDDSEKEEDILEENLPSSATSQVSEGDVEKKDEVIFSSKKENKVHISELNKSSDETECDSSSNMNLVYDEVEIGTENMEVSSDVEGITECTKSLAQKVSELDVVNDEIKSRSIPLNKDSNNTSGTNIAEYSKTNNTPENITDEESKRPMESKENSTSINYKVEVTSTSVEINSEEQDIPTSQSTNKSDSSIEWVVLDAVESSEGDVNLSEDTLIDSAEVCTDKNKISECSTNTEHISVEPKSQSEDFNLSEDKLIDSAEVCTDKNNKSSECTMNTEHISVEPKGQLEDVNLSEDELFDSAEICTDKNKISECTTNTEHDSVEPKSQLEDVNISEDELFDSAEICTDKNKSSECSTNTENNTVIPRSQLEDVESQCDYSLISGTPRKRTASSSEEEVEEKKPKLELAENETTQAHCKALKRPSEQDETTLKRSRLSESDDEIAKSECINVMEDIKEHESMDSKNGKENLVEDLKNDLMNIYNNIGDESSALKCREYMNNVVSEKEDRDGNCKLINVDSINSTTCSNDGLSKVLNEVQTKENVDESDRKECLAESESVLADICKVASDKTQLSVNDNEDSDTMDSSIVSNRSDVLVVKDDKETTDENKENVEVGSCSKDVLKNETNLKLDADCQIGVRENKEKPLNDTVKENVESPTTKDVVIIEEDPKTTTENSNCATSTVKGVKHNGQLKGEKLKLISKSPFELLNKNMSKQSEQKQMSNLDKAIESVVIKARRHEASTHLPILKKFHKDQLRRLTRSQLEEAVVLKICEAITDRSDIGQMRLRCKSLEQSTELWKKKAAQFEKQNRELEMVLKRFLNETAHIKKDNQNKMALPIKVTRSVGLQVVLASSVHGSLVTSRNRTNAEASQRDSSRSSSHQQSQSQKNLLQSAQPKQSLQSAQPKPTPEPQRQKTVTSQTQPNTSRRVGRPSKVPQPPAPCSSNVTPAIPQPVKIAQPSQPVKPPVPTKTISTPTKDLEVIDLTDKEEKTKSPQSLQTPVGPAIRVAPSTQVCFVQSSSPSTATQPMAYLVQKAVQRQQYLVATTTPSPVPRTVGTISTRQPSALAVPIFRAGGQIIPVQTNTVGVRTSNNSVVNAVRPVPRLQPAQISTLKHPAPLPSTPVIAVKPGLKAPPPKPQLKIAKTVNGIMLSWSMTLSKDIADMALYQLYAYQEGSQPPSTNLWKKVGDVKALPLPMACTLTQFIDGHKYHFAVRAVDVHGRPGPFSQPNTILLSK